ncbi:MAG: hypothetical protein AAF394_16135, partial [Planctomycetota bacterium]
MTKIVQGIVPSRVVLNRCSTRDRCTGVHLDASIVKDKDRAARTRNGIGGIITKPSQEENQCLCWIHNSVRRTVAKVAYRSEQWHLCCRHIRKCLLHHSSEPPNVRAIRRIVSIIVLELLNGLLNPSSLRALRLAPGTRVLDVGSGLGQLARAMARRVRPNGQVVG